MISTEAVKTDRKAGRLSASLVRVAHYVYGARRKLATVAAGMLAAMVGYHVVFGQNGLLAFQGKRHDAVELKMQLDQAQRDHEKLRSHVDRLGRDPNAIEHEAREELHYTRPGEVIFTLPPEGKPKTPREPPAN